jgi:allophanate hydrolase subunit 1
MQFRVGLAISMAVGGWLLGQGQTESPALELGREHSVVLKAGQYARFRIVQHTVNVAVEVVDPAGKQLFALDNSPIGETEDGHRRP